MMFDKYLEKLAAKRAANPDAKPWSAQLAKQAIDDAFRNWRGAPSLPAEAPRPEPLCLQGICFGCQQRVACPLGSTSFEWRCDECGADTIGDVRIVVNGQLAEPK
jgi:hypothetical protein